MILQDPEIWMREKEENTLQILRCQKATSAFIDRDQTDFHMKLKILRTVLFAWFYTLRRPFAVTLMELLAEKVMVHLVQGRKKEETSENKPKLNEEIYNLEEN